MEETAKENVPDVDKFIASQVTMNEHVAKFMEQYTLDKIEREKQQGDTIRLLQALTKESGPPPTKKRRTDSSEATLGSHEETEPDEATSGSVPSGKQKASTSAEAILGSNNPATLDVLEIDTGGTSLIDEELALYDQLNNPDGNKENTLPLGEDDPEEPDMQNMSEDQIEAYLCKEYSDWLSQTEEKVGPPVPKALGVLCERLWGKLLLSQDKKKEMQEGVDIPSNCKAFKAPKLNPTIHIRVQENSKKKDDAAKTRQVNLSRTAIPLLYTLGELDIVKQQLEGESKFLSHEPRNLDEAKKIIEVIKKKNEIALQSTSKAKSKVSKSFQLLNYYCTETTRKRRQDICDALGSAFKPYGLEAVPPTEFLFTEEAMKKMKKELTTVKPKVEASKNGYSSTKSRRSGGQGQGKNYHKPHSSNNSGNYNNNNNNNYGQGNNGGNNNNGTKKTYPSRRRGGR